MRNGKMATTWLAWVALLINATVAIADSTQITPPRDLTMRIKIFHAKSEVAAHPIVRVAVPDGYKVIGGGARVNWSGAGNMLVASYPEGNTWVASSKDHDISSPASIEAWAIGLEDRLNDWQVRVFTSTSGSLNWPSARAVLPDGEGYVLIGGGAAATWSAYGQMLTASYPDTSQSWMAKSKDHIHADPGTVTAYAIGIRPSSGPWSVDPITIVSSDPSPAAPHPTAIATEYYNSRVIGGGALVESFGAGSLLTGSYPYLTPDGRFMGWVAEAKDHEVASPASIRAFYFRTHVYMDP